MIERFTEKKRPIAAALAISVGVLGLTACENDITVHGTQGIQLVDCKKGPTKNHMDVDGVAKGGNFYVGKNIVNHGSDDPYTSGGLYVETTGSGRFKLSADTGSLHIEGTTVDFSADYYNRTPEVGNSHTGAEVTYTDDDQKYVIEGTPEAHGSTKFSIDASCVNTN